MNLQDLIDGIKEDSQAGAIADNADRTAAAIIRQLNQVGPAFWEMNPWTWGRSSLTVVVAAERTTPVSLDATIGEVLSMGIQGKPGELDIFSEKEWRQWRKLNDPSGGTTTGALIGAVDRGRDASGNLQFLFVPPPAEATTVEYVGKKRLTTTAYVVADISSSLTANFGGFFPPEVEPIIYDWTLGRFLRSIKDARGDALLASVQQRLDQLKGTQRSQAVKAPKTRPPDYIRFAIRSRGGRSVS